MKTRIFWAIVAIALLNAQTLVAQQRTRVLTDYADRCENDDWSKAFEAALSEGDTVVVPAGEYRCGTVRVPSGKTIVGEGASSILRQTAERMFEIAGTVDREVAIGKDIADFADRITLTAACGLKEGDDIVLIGQRNSLMYADCGEEWCLGRTDKKFVPFGEFLTVAKVKGRRIVTTTATRFPFYRKNDSQERRLPQYRLSRPASTVRRIEAAKNVVLRDLAIVCDSTARYGVYFRYAFDCRAENIEIRIDGLAERYNAFAVNWSRRVVCRACSVSTATETAERMQPLTRLGFKAYSRYNMYRILASDQCGFDGCTCDFSTHAFNISSSNGLMTSTDCFVRNCTARNDLWAGVIVQQGCIGCILENNTVCGSAQGVVSGGRNTVIRGNRVVCTLPLSTNYYYAHIKRGGTSGVGLFEGFAYGSIIENNEVEGAYTGILIIDGYERNNIFTCGSVVVRNNTVRRCVNGLHRYRNKYNTQPSTFSIKESGNTYTEMVSPPAK